MQYYHDLITQKSWQLLLNLKNKYDFVLIGGWAVYLYSQTLKSKDIDLILDYSQLEKLRENFPVVKNDRLKIYEAKAEETDIDIYLPYYSELGLPVEGINKHTVILEGFKVPELEILVLLKAKAFQERKDSLKGRKDIIDLVSLLGMEAFNFQKLKETAGNYQKNILLALMQESLKTVTKIEELNLNSHQMARFKKRVLPLLE